MLIATIIFLLAPLNCRSTDKNQIDYGSGVAQRFTFPSTTNNTKTTKTYGTTPGPPPPHCDEEKYNTNSYNLTFPWTLSGQWATSKELCLDHDYIPIVRFCEASVWSEPIGTCSNTAIKASTKLLNRIVFWEDGFSQTVALDIAIANFASEKSQELKAIDIYFIAEILHQTYERKEIYENPKDFMHIISNLMGAKKEELFLAQKLLNATDIILYSLDQVIIKGGRNNITEDKLFVRSVDTTDQILGGVIKNRGAENDFNSYEMYSLYSGCYENQLNETNFETAFLVPPSIITNPLNDHYFVTLFYNDHFFNAENVTESVGSWILSILIPHETENSIESIRIYYKEFQNYLRQDCQHWKYGYDHQTPIMGNWSFDTNATKFKDGIYSCDFNHTTHFGMLVSGTVVDSYVLDLLTIFGSVLSLIGIAIIFLVAFTCKQWRNKAGSKIILNVSLCSLLLIVLFIISDKIQEGLACIMVGIMLHYSILAQICWALTMSYSSYRRFYVVTHHHIRHVVLKFSLFSWGIPLIVVVIVASLNHQTYNKKSGENSNQICYPKDLYLKLGVSLPMAIVLSINLIIYVLIVKKLFSRRYEVSIRKHGAQKSFAVHKSLFLLFFVMGITWGFGILVAFTDNAVFLYVFCTTATLHGFVIFVFYVLDSSEVKLQVKNSVERLRRRLDEKRKSRDSQSMQADVHTESYSVAKY